MTEDTSLQLMQECKAAPIGRTRVAWTLFALLSHLSLTVSSACGGSGRAMLNDSSGTITMLPSDYQNSIECLWLVTAGSSSKFINIEFSQFKTECSYDYLYVYDGSTIDSRRLLAAYSGSALPAAVYTSSGNALLYFQSDSSLVPQNGGFILSYSVTECPLGCSGNGACIGGRCVCQSVYAGSLCSIPICTRQADCSFHGDCISVQSSGYSTCQCHSGYAGWNCSILLGSSLNQGQWNIVAPPGSGMEARSGHGMVYVASSNCLYIFGGRTMNSYLDSLLFYNLSSNMWTRPARQSPWPSARHRHKMALSKDGALFLHGGMTAGEMPSDELWSYNTATALWTKHASSPTPVADHTLTAVNGSLLYVYGGRSAQGALSSDVQVFSISDGTWTTVTTRGGDLPGGVGPRLAAHSTVYHPASNSLLVYGGHSPDTALSTQRRGSLYAFHLAELYWSLLDYGASSTKASYEAPTGVAYHTAELVGTYMLVYGGQRLSTGVQDTQTCYGCDTQDDLYAYHLGCHRWVAVSSLSGAAKVIALRPKSDVTGGSGRYSHAAALVRGNVLLFSAGFSGAMKSDVIAYTVPRAISGGEGDQGAICSVYNSQSACEADPECMWCTAAAGADGTSATCMSRLNSSTCAGSKVFSFCPGICAALRDCGSCAVQGRGPLATALLPGLSQSDQCVWCTKESSCQPLTGLSGTCLSANATFSGKVGWWNGKSEMVASLQQCVTAGPPSGLYWAVYMPPLNLDQPDEVFFTGSAGVRVSVGGASLSRSCCSIMRTSGFIYTLGSSVGTLYLMSLGVNASLQLLSNNASSTATNASSLVTWETVALTTSSQQLYVPALLQAATPLPSASGSSQPTYAVRLTASWWPKQSTYVAAVLWPPSLGLQVVTREFVRPFGGDNCSVHTTCLDCLIDVSCGWCAVNGSYPGFCILKVANLMCDTNSGNQLQQWPLLAPAQCTACPGYTSCSSCTLVTGCEWDPVGLACSRNGLVTNAIGDPHLCPTACSGFRNCSSCLQSSPECAWCAMSSSGTAIAAGLCLPVSSSLMINSYGQCQTLLRDSNVSSSTASSASDSQCSLCSSASTCQICLSHATCGWCGNSYNPLVGACIAGDFNGLIATTALSCDDVVLSAALSRNVTLSTGSTSVWSYRECPNVNECLLGLDECLQNTTCIDTQLSYVCQCQQGFLGDGRTYCNRTCYDPCVHGTCSGAPLYVCLCDIGWTGANCSIDCGCNNHSTCSLLGAGHCDQCKNNTAGARCELCAAGSHGDATQALGCRNCNCNGHGDVSLGVCNGTSGQCYCQSGYTGPDCSACEAGYYGDPRNGGTCFAECYGRMTLAGINHTAGFGSYRRTGAQSFCLWTITVFPDLVRSYNWTTIPTISLEINGVSTDCLNDYLYIIDGLTLFDSLAPHTVTGYKTIICSMSNQKTTRVAITSGYAQLYLDSHRLPLAGFNATYTVNACPHGCSASNRYCNTDNDCICAHGYGGNDCQVPLCPANCSGNGTCMLDGSCDCFLGYAGASCSEYAGLPYWIQPLYNGDVAAAYASVPRPRIGHTAVSCNGGETILLYGGCSTAEYHVLSDVWMYNITSRTWMLLLADSANASPPPRCYHSAICLSYYGSMVIHGGLSSLGGGGKLVSRNDTWIFDIRTLSWTMMQVNFSMPSVAGHSMTLVNNTSFILLGGHGESGHFTGIAVCHMTGVTTGHWTIVDGSGTAPPGLVLHTAVYAQALNAIYVHGGYTPGGGNRSKGSTYVLDIEVMKWSFIPSQKSDALPPHRYSHVATDVGSSYMIVLGGLRDHSAYEPSVFAYSYYCNQWFNATEALAKGDRLTASSQASISIADGMLVVGGMNVVASASITFVRVPTDLCMLINQCTNRTLYDGSTACSACSTFGNGTQGLRFGSCLVNATNTSYGCAAAANTSFVNTIGLTSQCDAIPRGIFSGCGVLHTCAECLASWPAYRTMEQRCKWCDSCNGSGVCIDVQHQCSGNSSCASDWNTVTTSDKCPGRTCQSGIPGQSLCSGCASVQGCEWTEQQKGSNDGWTCRCTSGMCGPLLQSPAASPSPSRCPLTCRELDTCQACAGSSGSGESINIACHWSAAFGQCMSDADVVLQCSDGRCGRLADEVGECTALVSCAALTSCDACLAEPMCGWCSLEGTGIIPNGYGACLNGTSGRSICGSPRMQLVSYLTSIGQLSRVYASINSSFANDTLKGSWSVFQCPAENECTNGHSTCDVQSQDCVDTPYSFGCNCKDGYNASSNGSNCEPICNQACVNGLCVAPNVCRCHFGFVGYNCSAQCQCNGHGQCSSEQALTNCSDCRHNTTGKQCEFCLSNFVGNASNGGECTSCSDVCHGHAETCISISHQVLPGSAFSRLWSADDVQCVNCTNNSSGLLCDSCVDGFFRLGEARNACQPCMCNGRGSTCQKSSGLGCDCKNNTQSVCTADDADCYLQQCSVCASSYIGTPSGAAQCYLVMSVDSVYCLDPTSPHNCNSTDPSSDSTVLAKQLPLPYGQGLSFAVQPKYLNVDLRVYLDIQQGGVDLYIAKQADLFLVSDDPVTGQFIVNFEPSYHLSSNVTERSRREAYNESYVLTLVEADTADVHYTTISYPRFLLFAKNVTRRLVLNFPQDVHTLKDDKFYMVLIGRGDSQRAESTHGLLYFRQGQSHIDLFVFCCVFLSCFFTAIVIALVIWQIKLRVNLRTRMAERATQLVKMAARPYATISVAVPLDPRCTREAGTLEDAEFPVVPIAVEPLEDGVSAVTTVMLRFPLVTQSNGLVCIASTLTAVKHGHVWMRDVTKDATSTVGKGSTSAAAAAEAADT